DVHRLPRRGARLLRRPRDGQHPVVLGGAPHDVRRGGAGADEGAVRRAGAGVRQREGVPPLSRRPLRQGQDALQDPPGRVRRLRAVDGLVRGDLRARHPGRRGLLRRGGPTTDSHPRGDGRRPHRCRARPAAGGVRRRRLGDRRRAAQDGAPRLAGRPPAHPPAAAQAALRGALVRLRGGRDRPDPGRPRPRRLARAPAAGRVDRRAGL
ncbi:MAG: FIG00994725: hypothetical protein, partial [uncultured Nocardioides sp.]